MLSVVLGEMLLTVFRAVERGGATAREMAFLGCAIPGSVGSAAVVALLLLRSFLPVLKVLDLSDQRRHAGG